MTDSDQRWVRFAQPTKGEEPRRIFEGQVRSLISALAEQGGLEDPVGGWEQGALEAIEGAAPPARPPLRAAIHLLADLARQGWTIRLGDGGPELMSPDKATDPLEEKARIRNQELVRRDQQLSEPTKRRFIESMEQPRLGPDGFTSIFGLMRDGRELAEKLDSARLLEGPERASALEQAVKPYVQFVTERGRCQHTGLRLHDIWRYFRHTWVNQATSVPGRSMMFLVRDEAAANHPVIGLGALGSPIVQIGERDRWIGWHSDVFLERAAEAPPEEVGGWLLKSVQSSIDDIYFEDLIEAKKLALGEIDAPTAETLRRLREFAAEQRAIHHADPDRPSHKRRPKSASDGEWWMQRARSPLFVSKRAQTLAELLEARAEVRSHLGSGITSESVGALLQSGAGRRAVRRIVRRAKAERVGIAMADITVCGCVAPYGPILGGKLVSMLAVSPDVVRAYRRRYRDAQSEIASALAARPIVRAPELVFLGTTSLYGVGSSQYNRVRIPAARLGGEEGRRIEYQRLGRSEAFGTSQFSDQTLQALGHLVEQRKGVQRVNSIFGEGVSPKLRKLREGLELLGLSGDQLLRHGRQRIVYGIALATNLRRYLLGMDDAPKYMFDVEDPTSASRIGAWWRERWLSGRIDREGVLGRVREHTLVEPIRHGARVELPPLDSSQETLFDEFD